MSDYSFRWSLLRDWEADFLTSQGIRLGASSISFDRRLSKDNFRDVLALLISMRIRTEDRDENHINFAIGDCVNKGSEWFGEDVSDQMFKEAVEWFPKRDKLLCFAASVLIYVQRVEHLMKTCCSVLNAGLSVDDLLSNNKQCQQATMGRLRVELEKRKLFSPEYEEELKAFVADRNIFVHSLWTIQLPEILQKEPTIDPTIACGRFILRVLHQAEKCDRIFKGLMVSIGEALSDQPPTGFSESMEWVRYTKHFEKVTRKA